MPPFIRPAQRGSRILATSLLVISLVAACDSSVTPTASPATPGASTSIPSTAPASTSPAGSAAAATPAPASAPPVEPSASPAAAGLVPGALAVTVSDRLRVRSKPLVDSSSALYAPLLPTGTQLQVIDGPVDGSGYSWVRVAPVGLTLDKGVTDGWVAVADHDGTPWVALADGPVAGLDVAQATVARAPVNVGDARRTAGDLNAFGLALYKRLLADPDAKLNGKGVIMSPASIAVALAMARAGARGDTATQMDRVLRDSNWNDLGAGLGSLQQILAGYNGTWQDDEGTSHSLSLDVTNRAFGQIGGSILDGYLQRIGAAFGAGLGLVDYIGNTDGARAAINSWVARQTNDRIKQLLGPTDVTGNTRLVLVNAIYMKANWLMEFDPALTKNRTFTTSAGTSASVPTMRINGGESLVVAQGNGWKATDLLYSGAGFTTPLSMTLILPDNLRSFERGLSVGQLNQIQAALAAEHKRNFKETPVPDGDLNCPVHPYDLTLSLPKFGIDTRASLLPTLQAMGMTDATDSNLADFSGITGSRDLFIANVIHQANIDVDEKGTEAAAATAVSADTTGGCGPARPLKHKALRLDHPFMFVIRDTKTGAILFMGRVTNPAVR